VTVVADHIPLLPAEEHARRQRRAQSGVQRLWAVLDAVKDPEIPVISIWELGVLQDVGLAGETVEVTITPTYCGCPAMDVIAEDIVAALARAGYASCVVSRRLSPAWSTAWIMPEAQEKLRAYGIAPPGTGCGGEPVAPRCPRCGSGDVHRISEFGSTACKALFRCANCAEPFDHFKPI
jgi:ring-1,2-phenylacetyl-CoA epoxidase subunit PaaD